MLKRLAGSLIHDANASPEQGAEDTDYLVKSKG